jgi:hypothetical protein
MVAPVVLIGGDMRVRLANVGELDAEAPTADLERPIAAEYALASRLPDAYIPNSVGSRVELRAPHGPEPGGPAGRHE